MGRPPVVRFGASLQLVWHVIAGKPAVRRPRRFQEATFGYKRAIRRRHRLGKGVWNPVEEGEGLEFELEEVERPEFDTEALFSFLTPVPRREKGLEFEI